MFLVVIFWKLKIVEKILFVFDCIFNGDRIILMFFLSIKNLFK